MNKRQCHCCGERSDRLSRDRFCPACVDRPRFWFHGGISTLNVGEYLYPPNVTGNVVNQQRSRRGGPATGRWYRPDRVYACASVVTAMFFAAACGGDCYLVAPEGQAEPDPTVPLAMQTISCERARIVAVVQRQVPREWRHLPFNDHYYFPRVDVVPGERWPAGICGDVQITVPADFQVQREAWLRDMLVTKAERSAAFTTGRVKQEPARLSGSLADDARRLGMYLTRTVAAPAATGLAKQARALRPDDE